MHQPHWSESFLPTEMLRRLHAAGASRPSVIQLPAALIFVDVSRYTSLVEQLVQRGPAGLELIPVILGRYWSRSIEAIYELGGETLLFAGDALLGYWAADTLGSAAALEAAVACAERLCQLESRRTPDPHEPSLHIGVGAGTLDVAALGGFGRRWNLLCCGQAVRDAAHALGGAAPGTWQLGENAAALRQRAAAGNGPRVPAPAAPVRGTPDLDWCCEFLPKAFGALLENGLQSAESDAGVQLDRALASVSELRRVSSVFVKLEGLEASPSESLERYQVLCLGLQAVLYQQDGPTGQLLFDDKGLVFYAAFGTPRSYHRDDATRAVACALEMRALASRHGLRCSIGVATGDGYFTAVGPRQRRELMLVGAPNNRAARLMARAPGQVLCDGATRQACGGSVRFEPGDALQIAGIRQVQETHRAEVLLEERAAPRLIGRTSEIAELECAFAAARAGESRLALIIGDAGIGKSFLVRSFLERNASRAGAVLVARAAYGERQAAYLGWRRILTQLVALPGEPAGELLLARLRQAVDDAPKLRDRWPLLSPLLGFELPDTTATAPLTDASRADAVMRFVGELVCRLAPPVSVLVLEDAHWLDSSSWRLCEWLPAQLGASLTILCLRRDEPCPELAALLERVGRTEPLSALARPVEVNSIELFELDEPAIHQLASKVLDDGPVSHGLGHRLWEVSRGNPLLAEELLLSLRSDSLVTQRDGAWRTAAGLEGLERFSGIERVITERIDRLDATEQLVLKLASVVGTRFHEDELAALLRSAAPDAPLPPLLAALRARHLVEPSGDAAEWQFRHDRTREVIYAGIPGTLRKRLHLTVARCLDSHPEWPRCRPDVLARHFHAAGVVGQTLHWADRAAEDAMASGAAREALGLLEMCLEHEADLVGSEARLKRLRWRRQSAAAWLRLGELERVKGALRSALDASGQGPNAGRLTRGGRAARMLSRLWARELSPVPRRRVAHGPARDFALELARTYILENVSRYYENDLLGCAEAILCALDWAQQAGPSGELVEAYALVGGVLGLMQRQKLAMRFFGRARHVAASIEDPSRQSFALMTQGLYHVGFGHWQQAGGSVDASQALAASVGDSLTWCYAQQVRFWLNHYQGQRVGAEDAASELLARAQNSGNVQQEIWALRNKAVCALSRDAPQLARDYLKLALATLRGTADRSELLQSTGCLALACARSGQRAAALEAARTTLGYLSAVRRPTVHSALEATSAVAEVLLRDRDQNARADAALHELTEQALAALKRHADVFPTGRPRQALWQGLHSWQGGKTREAVNTWEQGLGLARELGMRGDVALLEAELRSKRG